MSDIFSLSLKRQEETHYWCQIEYLEVHSSHIAKAWLGEF